MPPGQENFVRKMNNLHLYARYLCALPFNLTRVNLNYNSKVRPLFTKYRVGVGVGGGWQGGQKASLLSLTILDLI